MYLVGAEHPHKHETIAVLERLVSEKQKLVSNTEVLQEILHRYASIRRKEAIQPAFDALYGIIDNIFAITEADVLAAKELVVAYAELSARDATHVAQMRRLKIDTIFSFDKGFDLLGEFKRIPV